MPVVRHDSLARNWWLILLRGLAAVAFGVVALMWPGVTLLALALMAGAYAIGDGFLAFMAAIGSDAPAASTWWLIVAGVVGVIAGLVMLFAPGLTAAALLLLIGVWAVAHGVMEIAGAILLRRYIQNEWALVAGGLLSVAFGTFVIAHPGAGALAVIWLIASYAIAFGGLLVLLSLRLRSMAMRIEQP